MRAYSAIIVIVLLLAALAGSLPVARAEITSTLVDSSMSDVSLGSKIFQVGSGYYAFIRDSSSGSLYYRYISGTEVGDRVLVEGNSITTSYSAATNGTHVLLIYKVDSTVNYKLGQITSPGVISWVDSFMTGSVYIYSCAFYGATPLAYLEATNDGVHFIDFTTDSIVLQYEVTTGYDAQFLVSGSNLVMAYQDYDDDTYKYVTYDGASWSTPTTIVADSYGSGANMAIDPSLTVFAYYCTYDAGAGGVAFKVYMYEGGSWVQKHVQADLVPYAPYIYVNGTNVDVWFVNELNTTLIKWTWDGSNYEYTTIQDLGNKRLKVFDSGQAFWLSGSTALMTGELFEGSGGGTPEPTEITVDNFTLITDGVFDSGNYPPEGATVSAEDGFATLQTAVISTGSAYLNISWPEGYMLTSVQSDPRSYLAENQPQFDAESRTILFENIPSGTLALQLVFANTSWPQPSSVQLTIPAAWAPSIHNIQGNGTVVSSSLNTTSKTYELVVSVPPVDQYYWVAEIEVPDSYTGLEVYSQAGLRLNAREGYGCIVSIPYFWNGTDIYNGSGYVHGVPIDNADPTANPYVMVPTYEAGSAKRVQLHVGASLYDTTSFRLVIHYADSPCVGFDGIDDYAVVNDTLGISADDPLALVAVGKFGVSSSQMYPVQKEGRLAPFVSGTDQVGVIINGYILASGTQAVTDGDQFVAAFYSSSRGRVYAFFDSFINDGTTVSSLEDGGSYKIGDGVIGEIKSVRIYERDLGVMVGGRLDFYNIYENKTLTEGLVAEYLPSGVQGDAWVDTTGNGHDATIYGGAGYKAVLGGFSVTLVGLSNYVVNIPPFIIESTTPFVTAHYQPDGASYNNWTMDLYFEVVGGGNVTVWAPEGFPGEVGGISGWGPGFSYSAWAAANPPLWDFTNHTVTFYNIPSQGNYCFAIDFRTPYGGSGGGGSGGGGLDEAEDDENSNSTLDIGEIVDSALTMVPEPLRLPVAFTLVGLPIMLILLLITGGGATVKGAYSKGRRR